MNHYLDRGHTPAVSVVIPVRNGERFIEECLGSLYSQTFQDFEVIVVDNSSSDKTRETCLRVSDDRTRLVEHLGRPSIAQTINAGLEVSRGNYIARLDVDDIARSDRIEKQVDFLEKNPEVAIVGSWVRTFGERRESWKYPLDNPDIRLALFFRSPFAHPSVMYRRVWESGDMVRYDPELDLAEDFELWTRFCISGFAANIPEYLTFYRTHPAQSVNLNLEARRQIVQNAVEVYSRRIGLNYSPPTSSLVSAIVWWRRTKMNPVAARFFLGANVTRLQREHFVQLFRATLRGISERTKSRFWKLPDGLNSGFWSKTKSLR